MQSNKGWISMPGCWAVMSWLYEPQVQTLIECQSQCGNRRVERVTYLSLLCSGDALLPRCVELE